MNPFEVPHTYACAAWLLFVITSIIAAAKRPTKVNLQSILVHLISNRCSIIDQTEATICLKKGSRAYMSLTWAYKKEISFEISLLSSFSTMFSSNSLQKVVYFLSFLFWSNRFFASIFQDPFRHDNVAAFIQNRKTCLHSISLETLNNEFRHYDRA